MQRQMELDLPLSSDETSDYRWTLQTKRNEIERRMLHPEVNDLKFFPNVEMLWEDDTLTKLLRWKPDKIKLVKAKCLNSLTILVSMDGTFERSVFDRYFVQKKCNHDSGFPWKKENLAEFQHSQWFLSEQYIFNPFIIEYSEKPIVRERDVNQPWPFVDEEPEQIGAGAFGKVYKAAIAKDCYRNLKDGTTNNREVKVIAFKTLRLQKNGESVELHSLNYFRESWTKHDRILSHLAAVIYNKTFLRLFFEFTDMGDLEIFLNGGRVMNSKDSDQVDSIKYHFTERFARVSLRHMMGELIGICSALDFLHEKLSDNTVPRRGVYCVHMDLKPDNILVFPNDDEPLPNVGRWKITDFGIASFNREELERPSNTHRTVVEMLAPAASRGSRDRNTLQGPSRAPELHSANKGKKIGKPSCDVWSFGCIINEVLAFSLGALGKYGQDSVDFAVQERRDFRQKSRQGRSNDYWFAEKKPSNEGVLFEIAPTIRKWLKVRPKRIGAENPKHGSWIKEFVELIEEMLEISPERRLTANQSMSRLIGIRDMIFRAENSDLQHISAVEVGHNGTPTLTSPMMTRPSVERVNDDSVDNLHVPVSEPGLGRSNLQSQLPSQIPSDIAGPVNLPFAGSSAEWSSITPSSTFVSTLTSPATIVGNPSTTHSSPRGSAHSIQLDAQSPLREPIGPETFALNRPELWPLHPSPRDKFWSFTLPSGTKLFEISRNTDIAVFIFKNASELRLATLDLSKYEIRYREVENIDLTASTEWKTISVASPYLLSTGKRSTKDAHSNGCIIDLNMRETIKLPRNTWPKPCYEPVISSKKIFAWREPHRVHIWNPQIETLLSRNFEYSVCHICFNIVGTYLFVWTRHGCSNRVYILDVLDFSSDNIPTIASVTFKSELPRSAEETGFWVAQSELSCLIQESPHRPRRYIVVEGQDKPVMPKAIEERPPRWADSKTVMCDKWLVTVTVTGESNLIKSQYKFRIIKQRFSTGSTGVTEFSLGNKPKLSIKTRKKCGFRVAAYDDREKGVERVIIITEDGHAHLWEDPIVQDPAP